ncbi:MAG: SDR family oxidoreductase [Candidatus Dadabacteria bacterium]|nr:MAG: SDR family oxidoreductase [Candidatus Dadabacteria bacterium]
MSRHALFDLHGHVALVTGGNGGIGLGMARGLARAGAALAIWGRDQEKNRRAVAELRELGADAEAFQCDVASEESVCTQVARTLERFGRIDSCFANAGTWKASPFTSMTLEDWEAVLRVNLGGAFLVFREVVKHMIDRGGGGKLVAVGSIGAIHGMPRHENYSASKAGLCALIRSLAVELARHDIQANAILPGWVATDMTAELRKWRKLDETVRARTPARRWGTPEDFEAVAVYLASPASRFHTGDVLRIDGGYAVF